jgi:hypothetical protein
MQKNIRCIPSMEKTDQDSNGKQGGQVVGLIEKEWVKR